MSYLVVNTLNCDIECVGTHEQCEQYIQTIEATVPERIFFGELTIATSEEYNEKIS